MKFPPAQKWVDWGISKNLHRFFVLLWEEMFGPETPDTWQVRTTSVRSALTEIIDTVEIAWEHDPFRHNLPHIINETVLSARLDPIARRHFAYLREYLQPFTSDKAGHLQLDALHKTAQVLLAEMRDYPRLAEAYLREILLGKEHVKEKLLLNRLTMAFGTELGVMGYSAGYLASMSSALTDTETKEFEARLDHFFSLCSGDEQDFKCLFPLPNDLWSLTNALELSDGEFLLYKDLPTEFAKHVSPPEEAEKAQFALIRQRALDPYSARQAARVELEDLSAACNLFRFRGTFRLRPEMAVVGVTGQEPRRIAPDPFASYYMKDARDAAAKAHRVLEQFAHLEDADADQLAAALQHHKVGLLAPSDESKFLNFWIALECLVREEEGNTITRICSAIPPCLAVRNLAKQVRGLAIYIRRYWAHHQDRGALVTLFPKSSLGHVDPADLLELLLEREGAPGLKSFYSLCADNPLLLHRVHHLRTSVFGDAKKARDNVRHNCQNISWQLRRIYRARNQITHHGHGHPQLRRLLVHLHTYLVETIHALLYELGRHKLDWTVPLAFHHRRLLYEYTVKAMGDPSYPASTKAALLQPRYLLDPRSDELAWPSEQA